jgi:hypothetical protein
MSSSSSSSIWKQLILIIALCCWVSSIQATSSPTGQPSAAPTGVPTAQPTAYPTSPLQTLLAFNVTMQLREVSSTSFNSALTVCKKALREAVALTLGTHPVEGFIMNTPASAYSTEVFQYDYLDTVEDAAFAAGTDPVWDVIPPAARQRRLGITKGNTGSSVQFTVVGSPQSLDLGDDNDVVFGTLRENFIRRVERGVFVGVLRDRARTYSCSSLSGTANAQIVFISSDYLTTGVHSAEPTSMPTRFPRVSSARNRSGVMAGVLVGFTALLLSSMAAAFYKNKIAMLLGMECLLEREDHYHDAPGKLKASSVWNKSGKSFKSKASSNNLSRSGSAPNPLFDNSSHNLIEQVDTRAL